MVHGVRRRPWAAYYAPMWTKKFWLETLERAIKTFAQSSIALLSGEGLGLLTVDWGVIGNVALLAAVVSVLTSIVSNNFTKSDTPDLTKT